MHWSFKKYHKNIYWAKNSKLNNATMTVCFFNYRRLGSLNGQSRCQIDADQQIKTFLQNHQHCSVVIGLACHDCAPDVYQYISDLLFELCQQQSKKLIIIADSFYATHAIKWSATDVVFVDYWPMLVKRHARSKQETYCVDADQALCLTGSMDRINRIGILAGFFRRNAIGKIRYSWLMPDQNTSVVNQCKSLCQEIGVDYSSLESLSKITAINEIETSAIDPAEQIYKLKELQCNLDLQHWAATKFSIVNETVFEERKNFSITEKTWTAIYNRHPVLVLNHPGANQFLNSQGIQTLDQLIDVDFDSMPLDWYKIDRCVDLTEEVLSSNQFDLILQNFSDKNFTEMQKKCQHSTTVLTELASSLGLALENIQEHLLEPWSKELNWQPVIVRTMNADDAWRQFYNNIKDPSWPMCETQAEFDLLPSWIQQEILTMHEIK